MTPFASGSPNVLAKSTTTQRAFLEQFEVDFGGLDYDFFPLFDRDATWTQRPPRPVSSGATVIGDSDRLADSTATLLR